MLSVLASPSSWCLMYIFVESGKREFHRKDETMTSKDVFCCLQKYDKVDVCISDDETRWDNNFGGWCAKRSKCIMSTNCACNCLSKAQNMSNATCCLFGLESVQLEAATLYVGGRQATTTYSNTQTLRDGQLQQQQ